MPLSEVTAGIPRHGFADVHLLIPAFDYDLNRAVFFRPSATKGPHWGEGRAAKITLAEAIHASSNAAVSYFDRPAEFENALGRYWDGAITGCNNPVPAAVVEAVGKDQAPVNIAALSIGAGTVERRRTEAGRSPAPFEQPNLKPGIEADLRKLATAALHGCPDIAT